MTMPVAAPLSILLVEDNAADAELVVDTFEDLATRVTLHVVENEHAALDHLRGGGPSNRRPDLVLLDLNLPGRGGLSILAALKGDEQLRRIPVLVLTTSKSPQEIRQSYELGAAAVLNKPMRLANYREMLHALERFWLGHVRFAQEYACWPRRSVSFWSRTAPPTGSLSPMDSRSPARPASTCARSAG